LEKVVDHTSHLAINLVVALAFQSGLMPPLEAAGYFRVNCPGNSYLISSFKGPTLASGLEVSASFQLEVRKKK
jgi:hypothetical protein